MHIVLPQWSSRDLRSIERRHERWEVVRSDSGRRAKTSQRWAAPKPSANTAAPTATAPKRFLTNT